MRLDVLAAATLVLLPGGLGAGPGAAGGGVARLCTCVSGACSSSAPAGSGSGEDRQETVARPCCCLAPANPEQPVPRPLERSLQGTETRLPVALPFDGALLPELMPAEEAPSKARPAPPRASPLPLHLRHCVLLR